MRPIPLLQFGLVFFGFSFVLALSVLTVGFQPVMILYLSGMGVIIIVLLVFWKMNKESDAKILAEMKNGEYFFHWQQSGFDWQEFTRQEWQTTWRYSLVYGAVLLVIAAFDLFSSSAPLTLNDFRTGILYALLVIAILWPGNALLNGLMLYRRRQRQSDEVFINLQAVYSDGRVNNLSHLDGLKFDAKKPIVLIFSFSGGRDYWKVRLFVPQRQLSEVQKFVKMLKTSRQNKKLVR